METTGAALYDEVYGIKYQDAEHAMKLLEDDLKLHINKGFQSEDELIEWAHAHCLDKRLFTNMAHSMMYVSHKGEILTPQTYTTYYGNICYYTEPQGKKLILKAWRPDGFEYCTKAYRLGEQSDGLHKPLYYRDYTVPTGYYNEAKDAFNIAKPFPVFAKETGRDTSHIYTFIQHIAGECAFHLLAWLRAKLLYPTVKTQVVPILVSKTQGSGKTTFAEVICKGLFGKENVIVSDQYDATARFNADYADALIVCQEEKEEQDRRNPANMLKNRATATTIRKENKGLDPVYQESYTDFILTTNKDVPIKFEGREDQRRFMVMEADSNFTRKLSEEADEVFTKLYGMDGNFAKTGTPFVDDYDLIAQFKHELFTREDIAAVELRNFPHTAAYHRCFSIPRTTEAVEAESIVRSIAPFIRASLDEGYLVEELTSASGNVTSLNELYTGNNPPFVYISATEDEPAHVAVCRPLVFYDMKSSTPMSHATVERGIEDLTTVLATQYDLKYLPNTEPFPMGFPGVPGRYASAPVARFCDIGSGKTREELTPDISLPAEMKRHIQQRTAHSTEEKNREGRRFTVDARFKPCPAGEGEFETVNELTLDAKDLKNKTEKIVYMDTFLLESDEPTFRQKQIEDDRILNWKQEHNSYDPIPAKLLFRERLEHALEVSLKLFNDGKVCRIVYSGSKSYHLLVRVADPPKTLNEYKWLHGYLCNNLTDKLNFDKSTSDPARLTRAPIEKARMSQLYKGTPYEINVLGEQREICHDFSHVYEFNWRPFYEVWEKRPLSSALEKKGRPLFPTNPEYETAATDIISGDFWCLEKYTGDRQRLFFPSYRLLRCQGWTHDELWNEIIPKGLERYTKRDDVNYWLTRESCDLITTIDRDIDTHEEDIKNGKRRVD